ncbi:hypothetical protein Xaut_0994 [Xanthobacter versatilis]|uniref:Uncharacterized protein n=1 Tax=Xanthobacter autotrophicus (strain ATCC BAA-1158 / Py2) TaxID=78245 RepID=A7IE02_XANP2|nr:hypothetical protein Xaut_0994 [Xanthobacter autotrophicus Py2]
MGSRAPASGSREAVSLGVSWSFLFLREPEPDFFDALPDPLLDRLRPELDPPDGARRDGAGICSMPGTISSPRGMRRACACSGTSAAKARSTPPPSRARRETGKLS